MIEGKLQVTEEDKQPNSNIKPFGVCGILRSSCTTLPVKWDNTSDFEIEGKKELLDSSQPASVLLEVKFLSFSQHRVL